MLSSLNTAERERDSRARRAFSLLKEARTFLQWGDEESDVAFLSATPLVFSSSHTPRLRQLTQHSDESGAILPRPALFLRGLLSSGTCGDPAHDGDHSNSPASDVQYQAGRSQGTES